MPDIHPLIRLLSLLVFVVAAGLARPGILLACFLLLGSMFFLVRVPLRPGLAGLLYRLRWLFLAIILVYGWWTPGNPLFPVLGVFSPVHGGIESGLLRVSALLLIVGAVSLFLETTTRDRLLAGLLQLVYPFTSRPGRERFAVRTLLSIETVPRVQAIITGKFVKRESAIGYVEAAGNHARALYRDVLKAAENAQPVSLQVAEIGLPAAWQWLLPVALATVFMALA